jgi:hypothetical protein
VRFVENAGDRRQRALGRVALVQIMAPGRNVPGGKAGPPACQYLLPRS